MKLRELLKFIDIFVTNEEHELMQKIPFNPTAMSKFSEREQIVIQNLINKSLVTKINEKNNVIMVRKNA